MLSEADGLDIWRRAQKSQHGIAFRTDNRQNFTQRLYQIRARHREEDFTNMMLVNGPEQNEVWIIHRPIFKANPIKPMSEEDLDGI